MIESTGDWSSCELEEHIEEVRTRNEELSQLLTGQPFDGRVLDVAPMGLFHRQPAAVRFEAPLEHELGLVLFRRDRADNVLVEARRHGVRLDIRDEPVGVFAVDQRLNSRTHSNSLAFPYIPS